VPTPLSAPDSISPAFADTKQILFRPFRIGVWSRLAVVGLLTGEFAGGGWGGSPNIHLPSSGGGRRFSGLWTYAEPVWPQMERYLPWILLGVGVALLFGWLWLYVASVSRFILFEAVLYRRCKIREGWRRWRGPGLHYFFWEFGFSFASVIVLAAIVGVPVLLVWRAGWFHNPDAHFVALMLGGIALFLVAAAVFLASAVVSLFAKDFLVPVMALEHLGVWEGWRRLLPMLGAEKPAYAGYALMKIVLAVGSAILFGILDFFAILFLLIPLGLLGVAAYFVAKAAALSWNAGTISAVVVLSVAAMGGIFWLISFLYAPGLVFFQSYTLQFFASRYPLLDAALHPAPPPPEAPPPDAAPPAELLPAT
jgi:hypothetical protein